jgi:hypothetical protein
MCTNIHVQECSLHHLFITARDRKFTGSLVSIKLVKWIHKKEYYEL